MFGSNPSIKLLPNPFQAQAEAKNDPTTRTAAASASNFIPGYRSKFSVNQQKALYEQRKNQQQQQQQQQQQHNQKKQPHHQKTPQHRHQRPQSNRRTHFPNADPHADENNSPSPSDGTSSAQNWCSVCECGFKQLYQLKKHIDEHEKCWFDNCDFEGQAMVLKAHVEQKHDCKLFDRVGRVETDEDVEKWREERRKRYPTRANIDARRLAQEERFKRGERLQEPNKRFGDAIDRKRAQTGATKRNANEPIEHNSNRLKCKKRNRRHRNHGDQTNDDGELVAAETSAATTTAAIETDTPSLAAETDEGEKEEEEATATLNTHVIEGDRAVDQVNAMSTDSTGTAIENQCATSSKPNALTALLGLYGAYSDSENEDADDDSTDTNRQRNDSNTCDTAQISLNRANSESTDDAPQSQSNTTSNENTTNTFDITDEEDDDGAPDEQPIERRPDNLQPEIQTARPDDRRPPVNAEKRSNKSAKPSQSELKARNAVNVTRRLRQQNTLLEKMLQKDIRHERNLLLQCVRYVVENKFFGIGQSDA